MPADPLTELENCTLGVIRQHQPCSTYRVRSEFARSKTTAWSASAGSIYPVIERLLATGHVRATKRSGDQRGRRDLVLTALGQRAVQGWIMNLDRPMAAATPDPIRTRACFLDQVATDAERREFLALAESLTRMMIQELRAEERSKDMAVLDYLATVGSRLQLEARLEWLGVVRRRLYGPGSRHGRRRA